MNQKNLVKDKINDLLDNGYTNKNEIISKVSNELDVQRPTVRKLARELRIEFVKKLSILEGFPGVISWII